MKPLFDEYAERCGDEGDYKTQEPQDVDEDRVTRLLKGWRGEVRHGRVNKLSIDCKTRNLSRKMYENLVRKFFWLLLQVFVRFDDKCRDYCREETGLFKV